MKVTFKLTEKEYVRFNYHFITTSPMVRKRVRLFHVMPPVVFLIAGYILTDTYRQTAYPNLPLIMCGGLAALWLLLFPVLLKRAMASQCKRLLKLQGADLLSETEIQLKDSYMQYESGTKGVKVGYDKLRRVVGDGDMTYIYTGDSHAFLVPGRAFQDEAHKKEFFEIIRERHEGSKSGGKASKPEPAAEPEVEAELKAGASEDVETAVSTGT